MSDQGISLPVSIPVDDSALDRAATKLANLQAQAAQGASVGMGGRGGQSQSAPSAAASIPNQSSQVNTGQSYSGLGYGAVSLGSAGVYGGGSGNYGAGLPQMPPGVSGYYSQQYANAYQADPNFSQSYQTFMNMQSPMSMQQYAALNTPTQAMSASQVANINQTQMYNPAQQAFAQYGQNSPGAQISDWISQAAQYRGMGPFADLSFRQIQGVGRVGIEAASIYNQYAQLDNYETMNQRPNIMRRATVNGEIVGGGIGAAAGFLLGGGPIGASFGMQIGSTLGGAISSRFGAKAERDAQTTLAMQNVGGLSASIHDQYTFDTHRAVDTNAFDTGHPRDISTSPGLQAAKRMRGDVQDIVRRVNMPLTDSANQDYKVSDDEVSNAYNSIYEGMVGGGLNPDRFTNRIGPDLNRGARAYYDGMSRLNGYGGGLGFKGWTQDLQELIASRGKDQSLVDFVTTNIATRYGSASPEISKQVAPIFGSLPETNNNAADILMRFGPVAAGRYEESLTKPGEVPGVDLNAFRGVYNDYRRDERSLQLAQTQARGVGAASRDAYQNQMSDLAQLPDGTQSLAYRQLNAKARQAEMQNIEEGDISNYQLPLTRLAGEQARNKILPFSPGNSYKNDLQTLQVDQSRLGYYQNSMDRLRRNGQLSERDELAMTSTIENIKTDATSRLADLSEGMIDRLPAFSAGRPSGFHSYDSMQLVQMQLQKVGHPSRYWGALNGQQADFQDSFARGFAVPGTDRPWSRMSGLDSAHLPVQRGPNGTVVPVSVAPGNDGGSPDVPVPMAPDTQHPLPPGNRVSTVGLSRPITQNGGTDTRTMEQLLAQIDSTLKVIASRGVGQTAMIRPSEANGGNTAYQQIRLSNTTGGRGQG